MMSPISIKNRDSRRSPIYRRYIGVRAQDQPRTWRIQRDPAIAVYIAGPPNTTRQRDLTRPCFSAPLKFTPIVFGTFTLSPRRTRGVLGQFAFSRTRPPPVDKESALHPAKQTLGRRISIVLMLDHSRAKPLMINRPATKRLLPPMGQRVLHTVL